jgi:hypothetical protein
LIPFYYKNNFIINKKMPLIQRLNTDIDPKTTLTLRDVKVKDVPPDVWNKYFSQQEGECNNADVEPRRDCSGVCANSLAIREPSTSIALSPNQGAYYCPMRTASCSAAGLSLIGVPGAAGAMCSCPINNSETVKGWCPPMENIYGNKIYGQVKYINMRPQHLDDGCNSDSDSEDDWSREERVDQVRIAKYASRTGKQAPTSASCIYPNTALPSSEEMEELPIIKKSGRDFTGMVGISDNKQDSITLRNYCWRKVSSSDPNPDRVRAIVEANDNCLQLRQEAARDQQTVDGRTFHGAGLQEYNDQVDNWCTYKNVLGEQAQTALRSAMTKEATTIKIDSRFVLEYQLRKGDMLMIGGSVKPTNPTKNEYQLVLRDKHPLNDKPAGLCQNGLTFKEAKEECDANDKCKFFFFSDIGRMCPKESFPNINDTRSIPGSSFFKKIGPLVESPIEFVTILETPDIDFKNIPDSEPDSMITDISVARGQALAKPAKWLIKEFFDDSLEDFEEKERDARERGATEHPERSRVLYVKGRGNCACFDIQHPVSEAEQTQFDFMQTISTRIGRRLECINSQCNSGSTPLQPDKPLVILKRPGDSEDDTDVNIDKNGSDVACDPVTGCVAIFNIADSTFNRDFIINNIPECRTDDLLCREFKEEDCKDGRVLNEDVADKHGTTDEICCKDPSPPGPSPPGPSPPGPSPPAPSPPAPSPIDNIIKKIMNISKSNPVLIGAFGVGIMVIIVLIIYFSRRKYRKK